ncbi:helix-turn-helix domain-containing protein [Odoribacter laneus]|uniref:HTH cro/C1-type domain-containing protein n=1 Tax=Odoribacter laneus YIT 12061 TaxID=742817 RepID=H1DHN2_9BACT|nr:helix-turn-helix transcriptional regulator [Odoribacter laneus]EHP47161.1 hypothetical protein HMPREF9449_01768 [Odoribacter laneus YIT 12061]
MRPKEKTPIQLFVSKQVKTLREERGLTQEQFAENINRSRVFFANRENPHCAMSFNLEMINTIAKTFNVSPKYFMPDEGL